MTFSLKRVHDLKIFPIDKLNKIVSDIDNTLYFTFMIEYGIYSENDDCNLLKHIIIENLSHVHKNAILWEEGYEDHTDIEDYYYYEHSNEVVDKHGNLKVLKVSLKTLITTVVILIGE